MFLTFQEELTLNKKGRTLVKNTEERRTKDDNGKRFS